MSGKPKKGLDRRDLLVASIPTVGAAAAIATNASSAKAQESTAASPVPEPSSGTVYTGDLIQGKKVVSTLDANDLEPGKKHALYFQGVQMPTGQRSDAMSEPGNPLAFILFHKAPPEGAETYPE